VGEVVTGSVVYWASHWWKEAPSEVVKWGGSTETLLALENNWERVEDILGRSLLSMESLMRRRPTKVMDTELGVVKERNQKKPLERALLWL
jgi:hypothetical protein